MPRRFLLLLAGLVGAAVAVADQVELTDGSILHGRVVGVEAGKLKVTTAFAGTLALDLAQVRTFATDDAVNVSLAGQPAVLAPVKSAPGGVRLNGSPATPADQVTALWRHGAESPGEKIARERAEKARRKWGYEATIAVTGRTGAADKLNATVGGKATLASDHDRLIFTATAERASDRGAETANRQYGGADYSWFYSPDHGWYVRSSLENDKIKALDLRSASAVGLTRKVIRNGRQDLEARIGASYTYEAYTNKSKDFQSPGMDFTLLNSYSYRGAKVNTMLLYVPTFRDFSNYRMRHESNLEIPLSASFWKLKVGVANEYQSVPAAGIDKFDTTYFTSLLLNWK